MHLIRLFSGQARNGQCFPYTVGRGGTAVKETPVLLQGPQGVEVSRREWPDFYRLFEHAILLALKEQGTLSDRQYQMARKALEA